MVALLGTLGGGAMAREGCTQMTEIRVTFAPAVVYACPNEPITVELDAYDIDDCDDPPFLDCLCITGWPGSEPERQADGHYRAETTLTYADPGDYFISVSASDDELSIYAIWERLFGLGQGSRQLDISGGDTWTANPAGVWAGTAFEKNIIYGVDEINTGQHLPPYAWSQFQWEIPVLWRKRDGNGEGTLFFTSAQYMAIDEIGTALVTKGATFLQVPASADNCDWTCK